MIYKYLEHVNEGKNLFLNIHDVLRKYPDTKEAEDELKKQLLGKTCIWYTKGKILMKKEVVNNVKVVSTNLGINAYFNDNSVNFEYKIEIVKEEQKTVELVGFPSGEILYVKPDIAMDLIDFKLAEYKQWIRWKDVDYKDIFFYKDQDYYDIKKFIDPNYKKPTKSNVEERDDYVIGDVVVCKGKVSIDNLITLDNRVGKIINKTNNFLVSFTTHFSDKLSSNNSLWVTNDNIAGIYKGDLNSLMSVNFMRNQDLEDHEIDDDYHINQLFLDKNKLFSDSPKPKVVSTNKWLEDEHIAIGDKVVLSHRKEALYNQRDGKFVDVWYDIGHSLGSVKEVEKKSGLMCVKTSNADAWYKINCVKKK